jgi:hypothetical protein
MISPENRYPLFRIMLVEAGARRVVYTTLAGLVEIAEASFRTAG